MRTEVLVTVSGLQMTQDGDDTVEVTTAGRYFERDGRRYLFYDEIDGSDGEVTRNTVEIAPHRVEVRKRGAVRAQMRFEENRKLSSFYGTPFGQLELGIHTKKITLRESEGLLELELEYRLEINNEHVSSSRILIRAEDGPTGGQA